MATEIPEIDEALTGELATSGNWVVASVQTDIAWPVKSETIEFRGQEFWVVPVCKNYYPALALKRPEDMSAEAAHELLMRLSSAVAWAKNQGILVVGITAPQFPRPIWREKTTGFTISTSLDLPDLPEPSSASGQLALALVREARGLNHPAYSFLSFYRVIETALVPKKRGAWIAAALIRLTNSKGLEAAAKLQARGVTDLGAHVYEARRMAIAHATKQPIVDPDDAATAMQLRDELPLMEALAVMAMEELLGIETSSTQWRKHLYELEGFKRLLGSEFVDRVLNEEEPAAGAVIELPLLTLGLRRKPPYSSFGRLRPVGADQYGKCVRLVLRDEKEWLEVTILLNFGEERLGLDLDGMQTRDDGSVACAEALADVALFTRDYLSNGELLVLDAETGERLSRVGSFIPVNCFVNWDGCNAIIEHWQNLAVARAALAPTGDAPPV